MKLPRWARFDGTAWNKAPQAFRLILPLYGPTGRLESLHTCALAPRSPTGWRMAGHPADTDLRGLVLADALGRRWLQGVSDVADLVAWAGLLLAPGDPDFLKWATHWKEGSLAPAVLGILSGSWTPALAARIPDSCTVTVATHEDKLGERYAAQIAASLEERMRFGAVRLRRWTAGKAG
jgi:hypothetical protein